MNKILIPESNQDIILPHQDTDFHTINIEKIIQEKSKRIHSILPKFAFSILRRIIHEDELNDLLFRLKDYEGIEYMNKTLEDLDITVNVTGLDNIQQDKRYLFASNHPLGGLDGIVISSILGNFFNNDLRFLVNDLLLNIKKLRSAFVPVEKNKAQPRDYAKAIIDLYKSDLQIATFPEGLCSRMIEGKIREANWKKSFVTMSRKYDREIVPIYFEGRNSDRFYRIAKLRKALGLKFNYESILLPGEMLKAKSSTFNVTIGKPIPREILHKNISAHELAKRINHFIFNHRKNLCKVSFHQ